MSGGEHVYKVGDRVVSTSEEGLGVLDPDAARAAFKPDVVVKLGDGGEIVAPAGGMPDGWLLVSFDELGLSPVHPDMIEPEGSKS